MPSVPSMAAITPRRALLPRTSELVAMFIVELPLVTLKHPNGALEDRASKSVLRVGKSVQRLSPSCRSIYSSRA